MIDVRVNQTSNTGVQSLYVIDATLAQFPKEEYVVFVCATGARAGEMYFGIKDECKNVNMKRFYFLDAEVMYTPNGPVVK